LNIKLMDKTDQKIKKLLDKEFLDKLKEVGKLYGWTGDYCEIGNFIIDIHKIGEVEISHKELEPYD